MPALLDPKVEESATKRRVPVVTTQWLLDCFRLGHRVQEADYGLRAPAPLETAKPVRA